MGYEGELLNSCGAIHIDPSNLQVVAVSGDGPNFCGHLLLHTPRGGGYYFHVVGLRGNPRYMNEAGYQRYLKEAKKSELRRRSLDLPNPQGALLHIESLLADPWTWGGVPHNCVTFVEGVIKAGGGNWGSYSNCPALATADSVSDRVNAFFRWMESGVRGLYGAP